MTLFIVCHSTQLAMGMMSRSHYTPWLAQRKLAVTAFMHEPRQCETHCWSSLFGPHSPGPSSFSFYPRTFRWPLCPRVRSKTSSPTLISTMKQCVVGRAHYARVFHVHVIPVNVLPQEASTGLSSSFSRMAYNGSSDHHTRGHLCLLILE